MVLKEGFVGNLLHSRWRTACALLAVCYSLACSPSRLCELPAPAPAPPQGPSAPSLLPRSPPLICTHARLLPCPVTVPRDPFLQALPSVCGQPPSHLHLVPSHGERRLPGLYVSLHNPRLLPSPPINRSTHRGWSLPHYTPAVAVVTRCHIHGTRLDAPCLDSHV